MLEALKRGRMSPKFSERTISSMELPQSSLAIRKFDPRNMRDHSVVLMVAKRMSGKCLSRGTEVLLANGVPKRIEDIRVGEYLMGDDGKTARRVTGITSGRDKMYTVSDQHGTVFTCTWDHRISLKYSSSGDVFQQEGKSGWFVSSMDADGRRKLKHFKMRPEADAYASTLDDRVDMTVHEYSKLPQWAKNQLFAYRCPPSEFMDSPIPRFDPYVLGMWLGGDGDSCDASLTTMSMGVIVEAARRVEGYGMLVKVTPRCKYTYGLVDTPAASHSFRDILQGYSILYNKHIPDELKRGSLETRRLLLAGILDTDTFLTPRMLTKDVQNVQRSERMADDMVWLARSLGLAATKRMITTHQDEKLYGIHIVGDGLELIPTVVPTRPKMPGSSARNYRVDVEALGVDDYFGVEVDGNHRFVLGDFTVTHNSQLIKDLMYYKREKLQAGVAMSGTEIGNGFYGSWIPPIFVYNEFDPDALERLMNRQLRLAKEGKAQGVFVILDDLAFDKKMFNSKIIRSLLYNGRHAHITLFLAVQYMMDLSPGLRSNIDYVFVLKENMHREKLYKYFFPMTGNMGTFNAIMDSVTSDYGALVLDNTTNSSKLSDMLYWYRADVNRKPFRLGSPAAWGYSKQHHDDHAEDGISSSKASGSSRKHSVKVKKLG